MIRVIKCMGVSSTKNFLTRFSASELARNPMTWGSGARKVRENDGSKIFRCKFCSLTAKTKQGVAVHEYDEHNQIDCIRQYVDTTYCPVCLKNLDSRVGFLTPGSVS